MLCPEIFTIIRKKVIPKELNENPGISKMLMQKSESWSSHVMLFFCLVNKIYTFK